MPEFQAPDCQHSVVEEAFTYTREHKIPFDKVEITCEECGQTFKLPIPKTMCSGEMRGINIYQHLIDGMLDYLHKSTLSIPSTDQPGFGGCVHTGVGKWTVDKRGLQVINNACSAMGFN